MGSQCTPFVFLIFMRQRAGYLYCSLQLEDMHNCFGRMSHSSPVGSSILTNGGMGWHLDAKAGKCMMDFSFPKQINCSY
jgi:hypothetical protein